MVVKVHKNMHEKVHDKRRSALYLELMSGHRLATISCHRTIVDGKPPSVTNSWRFLEVFQDYASNPTLQKPLHNYVSNRVPSFERDFSLSISQTLPFQ